MAKDGKGTKIIEALKKGFKSVDELVELSGASKNTVTITLGYHLKNKGFTVEKKDKAGVAVYKIIGEGAPVVKKEKKIKEEAPVAVTEETIEETSKEVVEDSTPEIKSAPIKKGKSKSIWDE